MSGLGGRGEGGGGGGGSLVETPAVAHAQLGPGNGHPVPARGAAFGREVDDPTVVLHVLELVLLGGLHVHHRVLVHVLLQDHRLGRTTMEDMSLDAHERDPILLLDRILFTVSDWLIG